MSENNIPLFARKHDSSDSSIKISDCIVYEKDISGDELIQLLEGIEKMINHPLLLKIEDC